MTDHYFENEFASLHYYKFGNGDKPMLCFHGFGMHGKQFKVLEQPLGGKYTFYGFDLFFHKQTRLKDESLTTIKKGLTKKKLAEFILSFCQHENITRFSVIGYSMGTHYATTIVEEMGNLVDEYIIAAPSSINPGNVVRFFSKNRLGNKLLERLSLSKSALIRMLNFALRIRLINEVERGILYKEIETPQLRFHFYACFTYLRFLETDEKRLLKSLSENHIRSIFVFGKRDHNYPISIGKLFIPQVKQAEVVTLDANHELIDQQFADALTPLLL